MKLELKAKHFEGTEFHNYEPCVIEKAYKDLTGNKCIECVDNLEDSITGVTYMHKEYGSRKFEKDKLKAERHNWDDTVIRTIELIES